VRGLLERAISLAAMAHTAQTDKGGEPYIFHPLRVMLSMDSEDERIVAVLHDIIEDTGGSLYGLAAIFPEPIITALDAISRRKREGYTAYIDRVAGNALARAVKLADIEDNLAPGRIGNIPDSLVNRYLKAKAALLKASPSPSPVKDETAVSTSITKE